jgi:hypothetical protein
MSLRNWMVACVLSLLAAPAAANTFYVRADGGTAAQCTGKIDAPYPGSGSAQACAFHHPFDALAPQESGSQNPSIVLKGGDTLIIDPGSYEMGLNAPGAKGFYPACNPAFAYDCHIPPVPSGTAAQPTQILGVGWATGCPAPPQLWGSERASWLIDLRGSSFVNVQCLEITDHSACIESHSVPAAACNRNTAPYGPWASNGIYASDSHNVLLQDLNVHGMANRGILGGRLRDWTLDRVHIVANGWGGWDGDLGCGTSGCSSDAGTMTFQSVEVGWNGCAENYPGNAIHSCWGQQESGYGDGFGEAQTGGNWIFRDSYFHHNTQDGLDLLYADGTGSITVERTRAEGSAGNQIKLAGNSLVQNSVIVGNCSYFQGVDYIQGNNSGGGATSGDNCRALGNALVLSVPAAHAATVRYNTIISEGDCVILGINGNTTSSIAVQNNVLLGKPDWVKANQSPQPQSCLFYWDSGPATPWPVTYAGNLVYQAKDNVCPVGSLCADPLLVNPSFGGAFDPVPLPNSPLIAAAMTGAGVVPVDSRNLPRPGPLGLGYDVGATQFQGICDDLLFRDSFDRAPDTLFVDGFDGAPLPLVCAKPGMLPNPIIAPR